MVITQELLDELTAQAKVSPRLRMNYDLRNSEADQSQRMLNAIEPGSPLPIHRHMKSTETFVSLRDQLINSVFTPQKYSPVFQGASHVSLADRNVDGSYRSTGRQLYNLNASVGEFVIELLYQPVGPMNIAEDIIARLKFFIEKRRLFLFHGFWWYYDGVCV